MKNKYLNNSYIMRMNKLITGLLLLCLPLLVQAQEKKDSVLKLSLQGAQQYALLNNRSILNASLDIESAKLKVWETTAIGLPQISAKLPFQYTPELSSTIKNFLPPTTNFNDLKWSLNADLTVSQLIFSGSYIVGLQSAKVYQSLSKINYEKSKQDVLETVTTSYFNILLARENKQILDTTYNNLQKTYLDMQAMNRQGFVEETDVDQMQITLSNVKTSLDVITRLEDISVKLLKIQLGIEFNQEVELSDSLKGLINAFTFDQLLLTEFLLDNNVTYQMLNAQVKSQELLLKLKKSEFLPDIAAFYQHEKVFNDKAFTFNPADVIGVQLNIPIFSSGARIAKVGQAKRELLKAQKNKLQASDGLWVDFYSSRSALIAARENYESETKNLALSKKIYDRSLIKYSKGIISATELTTVQNQFLTEQSKYFTSIQNLVVAKTKLEKLLTPANK
jgi:outer membrane protein TolC